MERCQAGGSGSEVVGGGLVELVFWNRIGLGEIELEKTRAAGAGPLRLDDQGETADALRLLFTFRGEPGSGAVEEVVSLSLCKSG